MQVLARTVSLPYFLRDNVVVCEIAPAVVGLPDDISFGAIHTSRLFALHAEELTVGEYLKYAPRSVC